jgi:hypothetical protein
VIPAPGLGLTGRPRAAPLAGRWRFTADRLSWPTYSALSNPSGALQLGPVQVVAFTFGQALNGFGTGEASILVEGGLTRADLLALWSYRLWAWWDDRPVWCGWPTGILDDGGAAVTVSLTEVSGFLEHRQFAEVRRYDQVEQTDIARRIAAPVQEAGVELVNLPGPGFARDRSYAYLEGQHRGELLANLCGVIEGPEHRTTYGIGPDGLPRATLTIAYPRVGDDSGVIGVNVPGTAVGYRVAWASEHMRTMTFAVGDLAENAPEGAERPVVQLWRPQPGTGVPPRLDVCDDYPGTILKTTLAERAEAMATANAGPSMELEVTVSADAPRLDAYSVGDDVTVRLRDPLLEGGFDAAGQLLTREISAGEGTATWTIAVAQPPPAPHETLIRNLGRLSSGQARAWRSIGVEVPPGGGPDQ